MTSLRVELNSLREFRQKYRKLFYGMMCASIACKGILVFSIMQLVGWL